MATFDAIAPKDAQVIDSAALKQKRSDLIPRTSVQVIDEEASEKLLKEIKGKLIELELLAESNDWDRIAPVNLTPEERIWIKNQSLESRLTWKKEIIKSNNLGNILNSGDDSVSSADMVDQASSYTDKSVEMKALNRSRKLISKINSALQRIKDGTYGYCEDTGEPIGLKRLMARPVATLSIEAQERHERDEKIFVDD